MSKMISPQFCRRFLIGALTLIAAAVPGFAEDNQKILGWLLRGVEYLLRGLQHCEPAAEWRRGKADAPDVRIRECDDHTGAGVRHSGLVGRLSNSVFAERERGCVRGADVWKFCGDSTTQATTSQAQSSDVDWRSVGGEHRGICKCGKHSGGPAGAGGVMH